MQEREICKGIWRNASTRPKAYQKSSRYVKYLTKWVEGIVLVQSAGFAKVSNNSIAYTSYEL